MEEKYYLDTAIWMDYYEDRTDPYTNLGEAAFKLLSKLLASKSKVVVSTFLLRELEVTYPLDKIRGMTLPFETLMEKASINENQLKEAEILAEERDIPKGDAIHAILARDNNAILVSRDKHFQQLKDVCEIMAPEEIV